MTTALKLHCQPLSKDDLSNTLTPAWYSVEKLNVIQVLAHTNNAAIILLTLRELGK